MSQLRLRVAQLFLGALTVFYIGIDPEPFDYVTGVVTQRVDAKQKPSIRTIETS